MKTAAILALVSGVALVGTALGEDVPLTVHVVLVDKELNLKPVPRAALQVRSVDRPDAAPMALTTSLDGKAEVLLAPGKYRVSSSRPVDFQGTRYNWDVEVSVPVAQPLELSNDNASTADVQQPARLMDELTSLFQTRQHSIVTVWSEIGHGTGFVVDQAGLVLTNQHVIGPSEYIAIQFDAKRKVRAVLLEADPQKDVAVLWANVGKAIPEAVPATIATGSPERPSVIEGERVFTIGSPLSQRKIMTTGIASKIEDRAIISDININPGNSGGPLFNSVGEVVGITTFGEGARRSGPGLAGIVRIEEALPLLASARTKIANAEPPSSDLLPVEPPGSFPVDAIKNAIQVEKFDTDPYLFGVSAYDVAIVTPVLQYRQMASSHLAASKEKEKRTKKRTEAVQGTFDPLADLRNWAEYAGEYKPVVMVRASPKLAETFWSAFGRGLAAASGAGYVGAAKMRFKTDFYKMKLFCGRAEVPPIQPSKIASIVDVKNFYVNATDATYEGLYSYPIEGFSPECGTVTLQLFSEKNPKEPAIKLLKKETIARVWADFEPWRQQSMK